MLSIIEDVICFIRDDLVKTQIKLTSLIYGAELEYKCLDKRKYISYPSAGVNPRLVTMCEWREKFNVLLDDIACVIHHCAHPNQGNALFFMN